MLTVFAQMTIFGKNKLPNDGRSRTAQGKPCPTQLRCSCQTTRGESMTESSKTMGAKGDDDRCDVDGPTLIAS